MASNVKTQSVKRPDEMARQQGAQSTKVTEKPVAGAGSSGARQPSQGRK